MARPPSQRPGYNRRAQYGLFASYVVAVAGAIVGLMMVTLSVLDPTGYSVLRAGAAEITRPVSAGFASVVHGAWSLDEYAAAYLNAASQNVALRRQVDHDRPLLIETAAIKQENERLKHLLQLVDHMDDKVVTARLISSSASSARRLARLNAGSLQGVAPAMPVRAYEGLVGRTVSVTPNTADILLLTDTSSILPVRRAKDNIAALLTGGGDGTVTARPLNVGNNPFQPGDVLVTSGTGGMFPPNIPVAIVVRLTGDTAIAVPLANTARVDAVVVQKPWLGNITPPSEGPLLPLPTPSRKAMGLGAQ